MRDEPDPGRLRIPLAGSDSARVHRGLLGLSAVDGENVRAAMSPRFGTDRAGMGGLYVVLAAGLVAMMIAVRVTRQAN
jgi:hypothetical protein